MGDNKAGSSGRTGRMTSQVGGGLRGLSPEQLQRVEEATSPHNFLLARETDAILRGQGIEDTAITEMRDLLYEHRAETREVQARADQKIMDALHSGSPLGDALRAQMELETALHERWASPSAIESRAKKEYGRLMEDWDFLRATGEIWQDTPEQLWKDTLDDARVSTYLYRILS